MRRRQFLQGTAASVVEAAASASDRVRVGLIGCGGRGRYVAERMRQAPGVEFGAVADVYEPNAAAARQWAGKGARAYGDFRQLLEQKDLDAALIATPDHWHGIAAVLACQAGKDVYVEKPLAHNVAEGRAIVEAARRHGRIVQVGMQHRSAPHFAECARIVRSGQLGEVRLVRVWNFSNLFPDGIGIKPDSEPPRGLDWDMYLGPAPWRPFNSLRFLATYRWFWDYAGGTITDFGVHRFDTVHQIMGAEAPRAVSACGGRLSLSDAGETPDVVQAAYEYPGFVLSYEACSLNAHGLGGRTPGMKYYNARGTEDRPNGMAFYGTNGALFADRIGYEVYPENESVPRKSVNAADATARHAANFIECVRSRGTPNADAETGHRAAAVAHLGNIALKTGRKLRWDAARELFPEDVEACRLLGREVRKPWDLI